MTRPSHAAVLCVGLLLLVANAAYLAARADPTIAYYVNVALHPILGLALAALAGWRFRTAWKTSALRMFTTLMLTAAAALGIVVLIVGATRPYYAVVQAHAVIAVIGLALLAAELWRMARPGPVRLKRIVAAAAAVAFVTVCSVALARATRDDNRARTYRITNPDTVPVTMNEEGGGPDGPFFPSSAGTSSRGIIPSSFFLASASCGRCHGDIYEQWNSSMHHFASFNNQWYRKSIEYMQDVVGTRPSKWCAGCHDHAMLFSGRFDQPVAQQLETPEAQAGLGCMSCHAIGEVHGTMGQGGFEIEYSPLHELASSPNRLLRAAHDTLLDLAPRPHREAFLKPFHREQAASSAPRATRFTWISRSMPTGGFAASTTTTTGRRQASRVTARVRSTIRRRRRPAPAATCRACRRTIPRHATGWCGLIALPRPTRRCRSSIATRRNWRPSTISCRTGR